MGLTIAEAGAVQRLLDWVLDLALFEHAPGADIPDDEEFVRIVGVLADRSQARLGAGMSQGDAIAQAMRLLQMGEFSADPAAESAVPS